MLRPRRTDREHTPSRRSIRNPCLVVAVSGTRRGSRGRHSLGEEVGAAVALKPDASATPEEPRAFARDKIAVAR